MTFYGYRRPDGRVGVRNKVLILPASVCASDTTRIIAQQVTGYCYLQQPAGLRPGGAGPAADHGRHGRLCGQPQYLRHGGGVPGLRELPDGSGGQRHSGSAPTSRIRQVIIQESGGTLKAVDQGVRYAKELVEEASLLQKEEFPISELIVGTECGGSDPTSGLAANVLIGELSDRLVAAGGTSILSETTELIGAEHILARRAANKEVHDRIFEIVHRYEKALQLVGEEVREGNPSPGNKAGGITTLEEKSLGCIHKGGHSPINAVYDYAKQVTPKSGLVIMDTPGNDPSSVAAMVAGGAQVVVFSTGRGSPTGNPIAPVIKITGNRITFANMEDNIDVDASPIIYGGDLKQLGDDLLKLVADVASGKQTKAESLGFTEMAIARVCNFV